MKYLILLLFANTFSELSFAQSLSPERVAKIKAATVKIILEGGIPAGTGFFIDELGSVITCGHVVLPAVKNNKRTYIQFNNGDTAEVGTPDILKPDTTFWANVYAYDFFLLFPVRPFTIKTPFLKLGKFENIQEGDEVYTCGYPLGHPQQFISKGIVSTKYINNFNLVGVGKKYAISRGEALFDMTMNRGNSGGAIVKIGNTIEEDEVIGIASFIINPLGNRADSILKSAIPLPGTIQFNWIDSSGKTTPGIDVNSLLLNLTEALGSTSIGVSGGISINHLVNYLRSPMKK